MAQEYQILIRDQRLESKSNRNDADLFFLSAHP